MTTPTPPIAGAELPTEPKKYPWAWAVVDPNERLRNSDGEKVDMLICWDRDDAVHWQEIAADECEAGDELPYIVDLFPAAKATPTAPPEASLEKALRRQKESHGSIAAVLREGATAKGLAACIEQCEKFAEEARKLLGCVAVAAMLFCTGCSPCPYPTDCKIGVDCNHCKRGLCQCCDGQCWCDAARTNQ